MWSVVVQSELINQHMLNCPQFVLLCSGYSMLVECSSQEPVE